QGFDPGRSRRLPRITVKQEEPPAPTSSGAGKSPALVAGLFLSAVGNRQSAIGGPAAFSRLPIADCLLPLQLLPQPPSQILDELPGDAAGAAAAGRRPLQ